MKCISLWQPWASLWVSGIKRHETRHWQTKHRGPMLVHAAKKPIKGKVFPAELRKVAIEEFGLCWDLDLPLGAIVGMVNIADCKPTEDIVNALFRLSEDFICGDYAPNRFGWLADEFVTFDKPIPYIGRQGIFNVPESMGFELQRSA